jgi:maleylacetoacetate isomerase
VETHPQPPLLPAAPADRARVRRLAAMVACDIHPLGNLRVLRYLRREFAADEAAITAWIHHWIGAGFQALEALLADQSGRFCHGDAPTLADVCLVPQMYNARRFGLDLAPYPTLVRVDAACQALPDFAGAAPERQAGCPG